MFSRNYYFSMTYSMWWCRIISYNKPMSFRHFEFHIKKESCSTFIWCEDLLISYSKISSYQCYKTACSYEMLLSNHCCVLIWWQKICVYCLLYIMERIETNDRWFRYKITSNNNTQMRNRNINESKTKCNLYKSECTEFMAYLFIIGLQQ